LTAIPSPTVMPCVEKGRGPDGPIDLIRDAFVVS
jgi:hypothetical protein